MPSNPRILNPEMECMDIEQLRYGTPGELVFTTITKRGMPMLCYRTHDKGHTNSAEEYSPFRRKGEESHRQPEALISDKEMCFIERKHTAV